MEKLESMSIDRLVQLRGQVDETLNERIAEQRQAVQAKLGKLDRVTGSGSSKKGAGGSRGAVAPKYRNPNNPEETWAGRGLKPRWLVAALKGGKKLESFSIEAVSKKRGRPMKKANGQ